MTLAKAGVRSMRYGTWVCAALVALAGAVAGGAEPRLIDGLQGAVKIPFDMPVDGEATLALYTPGGRVVRILGQLLELPKGPCVASWDGLDLWGNPVPAGGELVMKVYAHRPLRAIYEFTVGTAADPPWLTRPEGEGPAMRTGGWLADHTPPSSALAFGDRVFFGSGVAEHGHAMIATNLDGRKLWGRGGLTGWKGPTVLATDGQAIFGAVDKNRLYRVEPEDYKARELCQTGKDEMLALAAWGGEVYVVVANSAARVDPLARALDAKDIDFLAGAPQVAKPGRVPENQLDAQQRFAAVFLRGGHPQTGLRSVDAGGFAYFLARFNRPVRVGTVVLEPMEGVAEAQVMVLKPGVKYDRGKHVPKGGIDEMLTELTSDWQPLGATKLERPLNFLIAPRADLQTEALCVRLLPPKGRKDRWPPEVGMCRILTERVTRVDRLAKDAAAWRVQADKPISEVNPAAVAVDLKSPTTFDGLCVLNCTGPAFAVDAYVGPADAAPEAAKDAQWRPIGELKARQDRRNGSEAASTSHNERYLAFDAAATTRAVRLRFTAGRPQGRFGSPADVRRVECDDLALLKLADQAEPIPTHVLQVRDAQTGDLKRPIAHPSVSVSAMAFDAKGELFCAVGGRLCRSRVEAGRIDHNVLNDKEIRRAVSLAVSGDRIVVGDAERGAVLLFDRAGKLLKVIGERGDRKAGPWDPNVIASPTGVAIDRAGKVWVAECRYAPKRISRFSAQGLFEKELLGPAEYGGGGFLDPDLKSFYYRGMQFSLDFAKGTSRLIALNDQLHDPNSPSLAGNTFKYTKIGRPVYYKGRRYLVGDPGYQGVGGVVVCLLADGSPTWRPCAVMALAAECRFLVGEHKPWREHWLGQDLTGKGFIWCDRNSDGRGQVEEVELFDLAAAPGNGKPFDAPYWCAWIGPDLTFWGKSARLAPSRFTHAGVPIYEAKHLQPFDRKALWPTVTSTLVCGMRAKPGPEDTSIVTRDGGLIIEAQPFKVLPDMTVKGGPPPGRPSDYIPPVLGQVLDNPLHWVGTAETGSPAGEVGVMLGNSGRWFVMSADDGVMLGQFFTGADGGWGGDLPAVRGTDVTGRRLGAECFFGHFIKAHNGKYYVVAGHGFHALSRIEGLDDIKPATVPVKVTAEAFASNQKLRPLLAQAAAAMKAQRQSKTRAEMTIRPLEKRTKAFQLDGDLADWGGPGQMQRIGEQGEALAFDAAWDRQGLYLAYSGVGRTANNSQDWQHLFKTGFCFDFRYRTSPSRSGAVVAGDRRIVFGPHEGKWIAVLYDYVDESVPNDKRVQFSSPLVTTTVARVVQLSPDEATVAFRAVRDLDVAASLTKGTSRWSAEVFLKWPALGLQPPAKDADLTCDFGILTGDSGGTGVEKRCYWSNRAALTVSDLGVEAQLQPATWGKARLVTK